MKLTLPYGQTGLEVELPDSADVYLPRPTPALPEPMEAVCRSLSQPFGSPPLRDLLRADQTVAVVVSDMTRPVPNRVILPPLLQTIAEAGVPNGNVAIIVGTGMHRPMTGDELVAMLGEETVESYRIVNHDARDRSTLDRLTTSKGVEVRMSREYLKADFKLLTGFIEPHIFAGYSGGGKAVLPGLCGAETILANHGYNMLADPHATWCETDRNPVFQDIRNTVLQTHPDFIVNVTLNEKQEITGVFSGEMCAAHESGIAQAASQALTPIPQLYDVAVTTNMGWPADLNVYQSMKGMSAAALAVKPGGSIVITTECVEGLGNDDFTGILRSGPSLSALLRRIGSAGYAADEQWGVQCLAIVCERADVYVKSCLTRRQIEGAHLRHCDDVSTLVARLVADYRRENGGREASVCVLPHGQLTIPRLDG